ncbi:hypothetical protein RJ639_012891 [Escallonia herrerae]|uniref:Uncharacterized protein n=1 Tax=Escallonia herrerae TaxID=1293975 RepID=A0AA88VMM9_9ASTE|nr:hypothetical protein RJ639_012891 [Escallonia herrerae]
MSAIATSMFTKPNSAHSKFLTETPSALTSLPNSRHSFFQKCPPCPSSTLRRTLVFSKPSEESDPLVAKDEWLKRLPDKNKPLYSHSLPCIEAWLKKLGFQQSIEDRAIWSVEKPDWHAQLSLDVTDLYIRYLKNGPGNLEKDVERRFSYALSREDIENATLGGP